MKWGRLYLSASARHFCEPIVDGGRTWGDGGPRTAAAAARSRAADSPVSDEGGVGGHHAAAAVALGGRWNKVT